MTVRISLGMLKKVTDAQEDMSVSEQQYVKKAAIGWLLSLTPHRPSLLEIRRYVQRLYRQQVSKVYRKHHPRSESKALFISVLRSVYLGYYVEPRGGFSEPVRYHLEKVRI